jgi:ribose transport system ATP-binding protein
LNDTHTDNPAKAPLISARGLSKSFGANRVLKDVSLEIRAGEILVLLGPNGAGKSTFLNIIGGTLEPTEGALSLSGEEVSFGTYSGGTARGRGIQRVFQELSTFSNLTVAENLALTSVGGQSLSRKALLDHAKTRMQAFPRNRVSVAAEVSTLSVAERQMVEIARAMTEPGTRLVILDEPTSALSAEEADQLADLVNARAAEGVAIVYVTHKLEEALATLTAWAELRGVPYEGVPVGTIKRHATGKGNADKDAMIAAARARGFSPADDNEADAIALLLWVIATNGGVA